MKRPGRILLKTLSIMAGVIVGLVVLLQLLVNSPYADRKIRELAADYIDGQLDYSRLHFSILSTFPDIGLNIKNLSIITASCPDTLLQLGNFDARVNPWPLLSGKVAVENILLDDADVKLRFYPDGRSNLNFLRPSDNPDTSASSHPEIVVDQLRLADVRADYDDGKIYLQALLEELRASGSAPADSTFCGSRADVDTLIVGAAGMRLLGKGECTLLEKGVALKASLISDKCPLGRIFANYGPLFTELATELSTDAEISFSLSSNGVLSSDEYPRSILKLRMPEASFRYSPLALDGRIEMSSAAVLEKDGRMDVGLSGLALAIPGSRLKMKGRISDVLSDSRHIKADASGMASLEELMPVLFDSLAYSASGVVDLSLKADGRLSELLAFDFRNSDVDAQVRSEKLALRNAADTLNAVAFAPKLSLLSGAKNMDIALALDSLKYRAGSNAVRIRDMRNHGKLYMVQSRGKMTPRVELESNGASVFARSKSGRAGVMGLELAASLERRVRPDRRRTPTDSLRRQRLEKLRRGAYRAEGDFAGRDVKIDLDSTLRAYWKQWKPTGSIEFDRAFVSSPSLPLRTRIRAFDGQFDENLLTIDTIAVGCGSSDLSVKGKVSGIRRFVNGRGILDMDLDLKSKRLNLNELLSAIQLADSNAEMSDSEDGEELFITDTLENAIPDPTEGVIAVPGNIKANVNMQVDRVDYTSYMVNDFHSSVSLQDHTLRLLDTGMGTNLGNISLDAYYATRALDDIALGVNLALSELSVSDLLRILPSFETMMPALKSFDGNLSCDISATAKLDSLMNVLIPSVSGLVRLGGKDLMVKDAGRLRIITALLLFKNRNIGRIDDLSLDAVVHDGKLELFPFELGVDRYRFAMHGMHSYEGAMNYHISVLRSPLLVPFGINIYGRTDNWRFSLGRARYKDGKVPAFTAQMDSVQLNIGRSIKNIFRMGVEDAKRYNEKKVKTLSAYVPEAGAPDESVAAEVYDAIDSLQIEQMLAEWDAEVQAEVDEVLSTLQPADLIKEYESLTYQKDIERKMKRLNKRRRKANQD